MPRQSTVQTRHPRVIWTDAEKAAVVRRAVDTQRDHPDLAGLPLLRVAMNVLPPTRRRKLIAVTQAPFFEPAVVAEIKRRTAEERLEGDLIPIAKQNASHNAAISACQARFFSLHEEWRNDQAANHIELIGVLRATLVELKILNSTLGRPAPVAGPCTCEEGDANHRRRANR